ncbi:MAG: hypothetical protein mread185_000097 [Mycoplasmataceae bacterium]|nr:MAG: hypothetical protein mread185_000097 [Mycoplasmataceae bacterium]
MKRNQLLSFHTTIRNPKRYAEFLETIKIFDNSILSKELLNNIAQELITNGVFKPNGASKLIKEKWKRKEKLTLLETKEIMENSQQKLGWEERAWSHIKPLRELAFVTIEDERFVVTKNGNLLGKLKEEIKINDFWTKLLLKFQFGNPFRKSMSKTNPFLLTLFVIESVNKKWKSLGKKAVGISRTEFGYFVLSASNNNYKIIVETIIENRKKNGISNDFNKNYFIQFISRKTGSSEDKIKNDTIKDYTDNVIRHFRLTGLITFRGGARFIDLTKRFIEEIRNIMKVTELRWKEFSVEEYIEHLLKDDLELEWKKEVINKEALITEFIEKNGITLSKVREELLFLCGNRYKKRESHFLSLKEANIENSLKLEFLTAIIFIITFKEIDNVKISPNLLIDESGIPYHHAPGGRGDIEINYKNDFNLLVEVTLQTSKNGQESEIISITRHERELENRTNLTTYTIFIAPYIHEDSMEKLKWRLSKKDHKFNYHTFPMSIKKFVEWFVIIDNDFKSKVEKNFFEFKDNKIEDLDQIVN